MASPDKLFALEEVNTQVTQPVTQVSAQSPLNTTARDQQLQSSMTAFGNALNSLASYNKRKQIAEDINTAQEAAVRNEIMPGGLLPIAQQAFRDTQDIDTAHKILANAKTFKDGNEAKALVENQEITSKEKNTQFGVKFDNFFSIGASSIQNPASLQKLKLGIETLKHESMQDVLLIEQAQKFGTALSAVNGNIHAGFEQADIPADEIFTSKWVQNTVKNIRTSLPWVGEDDAKLAIFNLLATNEDMLDHTDIMANIIKGEFSKGVTFSALLHSRSTDAGKQLYSMYETYLNKVDQNYKDMENAEIKAAKHLNSEGTRKGIEYLDNLDEDDPNYPDRFSTLRAIMIEQTGADYSTYNQLVRVYETQENHVKNNEFTQEYRDGKINISARIIKDGKDLLEYVERNNLNADAYSRLNVFLRSATDQYGKNVNTLRERTTTVNNGLISAIKLKIAPNSKMMNILESASADDIKNSGVSMKELFGRISIDPEKLVNSLIGLAEERDKLKIAIDEEAEAALYEDREVDTKKISDNFNKAVENFIEELENVKGFQDFEEDENLEGDDAEDKEIEEQFKNTMEELREKEAGTISPTTSHPLPNYKLFDLSNNTSLIDAERKAAEYVNEIWNTIMLPLRAAEKLGKDVGQTIKEDIETITSDTKEKELPKKLDSIKKQIKNTGKLPDEVAAIVVPMFSVFGGTEAEAAESTDEPIVLDEITITAPKPIKSGTKKKTKNVGGMAGEEPIIQQEAVGEDVTNAAINTATQVLGDDKGILKFIANKESKQGTDKNTFKNKEGKAYHGGIFQIDEIGFKSTQDIKSHPKLKEHYKKIKQKTGIDWTKVTWEDLRKPLYSALAARLYLLNIPKNKLDMSNHEKYWKEFYNTKAGKG